MSNHEIADFVAKRAAQIQCCGATLEDSFEQARTEAQIRYGRVVKVTPIIDQATGRPYTFYVEFENDRPN